MAMSDAPIERVAVEAPDSVHPGGLIITQDLIKRRLGMELAVVFPHFETDGAGIVCHGEELERIGQMCGYDNVIASLYFDAGKLSLGIFVREGSIPRDAIDASGSETPIPVAELS